MHVALARKYRPRSFADLVGQEHVARALRGAVEQNRVAHGYLLSGPRGVGKTTAARILAMALNCETRHTGGPAPATGEPCGICASCERIWSGGASLDVVEIDAASNRGVDDARDLRERAMYAASQEGRHKVYIVDEAHMLTREAWNTLLKILEEPPPRVVFVFATTEPHKITNAAAPVMSRLQRFDFRRVGPTAIADRVRAVAAAEGLQLDADAVDLIARVANGGLRDALSVLDQVTAFGEGAISSARVRDVLGLVGDEMFSELLDIVAERRPGDVFPFVARLADAGVDLVAFAEGAADLWRAALALLLGAAPDGVSTALADRIRGRAGDLVPGDVLRILRTLEESETAITRGGNPRLALETLLVRWALMDRTVEIAAVLEAGTGERGLGTGGARAGRRAAGPSSAGSASSSDAERPVVSSARVAEPIAPRPAVAEQAPRSPVPSQQTPVPSPQSPASPQSPLSLDAVRSAWPSVLQALRDDRKMIVAETVADTEVAGVDGGLILLKPLGANAMTADGVRQRRAAIEAAAARVMGRMVRIGLYEPGAAGTQASGAGETKVKRVTVSAAKAERAKTLRGKDPALDSAMDALDLELLD